MDSGYPASPLLCKGWPQDSRIRTAGSGQPDQDSRIRTAVVIHRQVVSYRHHAENFLRFFLMGSLAALSDLTVARKVPGPSLPGNFSSMEGRCVAAGCGSAWQNFSVVEVRGKIFAWQLLGESRCLDLDEPARPGLCPGGRLRNRVAKFLGCEIAWQNFPGWLFAWQTLCLCGSARDLPKCFAPMNTYIVKV